MPQLNDLLKVEMNGRKQHGRVESEAPFMRLVIFLIVAFLATAGGNELDIMTASDGGRHLLAKRSSPWVLSSEEEEVTEFESVSTPGPLTTQEVPDSSFTISEEHPPNPRTISSPSPIKIPIHSSGSSPIITDDDGTNPKRHEKFPSNKNDNEVSSNDSARNYLFDANTEKTTYNPVVETSTVKKDSEGIPFESNMPTNFAFRVQNQNYAFNYHESELKGGFLNFNSNNGSFTRSSQSGVISLKALKHATGK